jgi:uncharacterized repeat protein (TIGR02543 family)
MRKMLLLVMSFLLFFSLFGCKTEKKLIVYFECNGGTPIEAVEVETGGTFSIPETSREGFFFSGWYLDQALTIPYEESSAISANVTLYAKWMDEAEAFYEALCDYLEKLTELSAGGEILELAESSKANDYPFLRLTAADLLLENQYDREYFADVYEDQKDNSNVVEIYEELFPYKLVLEDIQGIFDSGAEIVMDAFIELEDPDFQGLRYRFSILENEYILINSEPPEGMNLENTNLKIGFDANGNLDLKEYLFVPDYPDSFHYFEFVETDHFLHIMYLDNGQYHYTYRSEKNNESFSLNFEPRGTLGSEKAYMIQWYSDETHVRSSIQFENETPVSELYEVFNDKGVVFRYRAPSLSTENAVTLTWNMLETTGWDYAYVEDIESHSRADLDGIYKNGFKLFPYAHLGVYKNPPFAHLSVTQDFTESEVTDGLVMLSDYGLVFYGNQISLAYISDMRTRSLAEVQTKSVYDGVDLLGSDIRTRLLEKIDPDLLPNFD